MDSVAPAAPLLPPRRGRPPMAGLRQTILTAAEAIFAHRDYHEVLMEDVAQTCGVGKGTLYRYFPSKRALYLAVMFEGIDRLHAELQRTVGGATTPARKIECLVRCILTHFWDRRVFFSLIHRNEYREDDPDSREWLQRRAEIAAVVEHTLEESMAAGHVRRMDPRIAGEMLLGMLRGVNRYRNPQDRVDEMVAAVVGVFLCGMATASGRRCTVTGRKRTQR